MASINKLTMTALALMTSMSTALPLERKSATCSTYGLATPAGFTDAMMSQWCGMVQTNVLGLTTKEDPTVMLPTIEALYKQANIGASAKSALPNVKSIMKDPMARAAVQKTMDNYPTLGSMDNTAEDIQEVYAPAIKAACAKTGIPEDILVKIIWTESKGFPLVYQGLTQMDYVAWGQMVDQNTALKNRYSPKDNIVAAAMYLADKKAQFGGDWWSCYKAHYQG